MDSLARAVDRWALVRHAWPVAVNEPSSVRAQRLFGAHTLAAGSPSLCRGKVL